MFHSQLPARNLIASMRASSNPLNAYPTIAQIVQTTTSPYREMVKKLENMVHKVR